MSAGDSTQQMSFEGALLARRHQYPLCANAGSGDVASCVCCDVSNSQCAENLMRPFRSESELQSYTRFNSEMTRAVADTQTVTRQILVTL